MRTHATRLCAAALCALALCTTVSAQGVAANENAMPRAVINTKPLQDVVAEAKGLLEQGRLGSDTRVDVTAKGERNDDGSLKPDTVVFNWDKGGDEAVVSLAQHLVSALSQSKLFGILEGAKEVSIRFRLDESNALLSFAADLPSVERAKQLAEGYAALLKLAVVSKDGTREGELYKSVKVESDGGRFTFTFEMSKESLGKIIADTRAKQDARSND